MSLFSRISIPGGEQGKGGAVPNTNDHEAWPGAEGIHRLDDNDGAARSFADGPRRPSKKASKAITNVAGTQIKTLRPGDITNYPKRGDTCAIHYEAFVEEDTLVGGPLREPFDSSRARGTAFQFRLGAGQVIEGVDVAVSKMSLGQEVEATIPHARAYGVAGYPPIVPPRATLIFRIELISFSAVA